MITINIEIDNSCQMARVNDGMGNRMEGNFWDFHNGCHGLYQFDEFNNLTEFAYVLKKFHEARGEMVEIIKSEYKYDCQYVETDIDLKPYIPTLLHKECNDN